ncbi:NADH-quinone oxidoreductase subunit H, partial [Candidatus Poribacteria bacterium]|nr:NADH-quinone oxidoreductase subunit H [Candidatus Poribacteria bacterium]
AGRVGPPVLQLYFDLAKLFRKGMVLSDTTTWVFLAGPVTGLCAVLFASLFVPLGTHLPPLSFTGDFVLVAYLFGLARFFTASAALDTGSAFEGMGAAREVTFSCLAEPALFLGLVVLALMTGSFSMGGMLTGPRFELWLGFGGSLVLVGVSWFIVLLAENYRIPFDDPNTHLELTMIHEVMVLDHSGPAFGMILYGAAVKLFVLGALVMRIALPFGTGNAWLDWLVFVFSMIVLAILVGIVESMMARLRLVNVPRLLVSACLMAAFGVVMAVR